ncbi:MAG: AsmA family protein [Roseovarius sp.]|uniref:AsmA family protein n=1 Tax=Alterinioella nitratireducens TaxID=2735915 RepID=UPI0040588126
MRWIFRIVGALVLVAVLAIAALFVIPAERIAALAGDQFERATGRSMTISGDVRPSIWPTLGVRAEGVVIGNPAWVEDGPLLQAEVMHVGIGASALWGGRVQVQRFELVDAQIVLVRGEDGAVSWDFSGGEEVEAVNGDGGSGGSGLENFSLDIAEITNGALFYRDSVAETELRISDVDMVLTLPSAEGRATLEGGAVMNGAAISIDGVIDGVGPLLEGDLRPVVLTARWTGGEAGFDGRVGLVPLGVEGTIALDATDLDPVMALAGQPALELPRGLGRDRIAMNAAVTLASEGSTHLREASIVLDDNRLTGDVDILPGDDRPMIRARLQGGALDLTGLSEGGAEAEGGAGATGWSRDPIDVSGLFGADADVALVLAGLDLGMATLDAVDIRATLQAGRLVTELREVAGYGGTIGGQFIVNGRGGLSMRSDLRLNEVQLAPLLTQFAGYERLEGTGSGTIDLLLVGNSMHALMNSVSGSGSLDFGQGAILGLDIWGMIRNLDTSYQGEGSRTVYDSLAASFTVADGVLSNEDFAMESAVGRVSGSGTVGLGARVLDYTIIPEVLAGEASGIRVPLRISGAWSDPNFSIDLEALAEAELQEQIDALEEQATGALQEAASEALGTDVETVEDLEDALEDRLREEAETQLLRLFGGGSGN